MKTLMGLESRLWRSLGGPGKKLDQNRPALGL
jgi:hypothetical protein